MKILEESRWVRAKHLSSQREASVCLIWICLTSVHFVALKQQKILLNHYASKEDHQAVLDTFQQLRRFDEVFSTRDLVDVARYVRSSS